MREIKFRVRNKSGKKLIGYEHFNTILNNGYYFIDIREPEEGRVCHTEFSERPMLKPDHPIDQLFREQYTGLKDKNGTEIYEGDIILITYHGTNTTRPFDPKEVKWIDNSCGFNVSLGFDCKVIGNIHENPDLLEVK